MNNEQIDILTQPNIFRNLLQQEEKSLCHLLIIDEENTANDLLKMVLGKESFEVVTVSSGKEGLAYTQSNDVDAVIIDMQVPNEARWDTFKTLRASCKAPIILLSAVKSPRLVTRALDLGADEILTKPVSASTLTAHLRRLTKRAQAEKDASGYHSKN
jgi:DNA-binding response OmpR family regulator